MIYHGCIFRADLSTNVVNSTQVHYIRASGPLLKYLLVYNVEPLMYALVCHGGLGFGTICLFGPFRTAIGVVLGLPERPEIVRLVFGRDFLGIQTEFI